MSRTGPRPKPDATWAAAAASDERADLGEGARWCPGLDAFAWVDITAGTARFSTVGPPWSTIHVIQRPGFLSLVQPLPAGGMVLALTSSVQWLSEDHTVVEETRIPLGPSERLNDGAVDAQGRLFIGSMSVDARPGVGRVWRVERGSPAKVVWTGATIPNGLGWASDGTVAYWVDSGSGELKVIRCDPDSGAWTGEADAWSLGAGVSSPDGLTVDRHGCVWVAMWDGWAVERFDTTGCRVGRVPLPVSRPTSCAFGGPESELLFITTASYGLDEVALSDQPHAGRVFVAKVPDQGGPA